MSGSKWVTKRGSTACHNVPFVICVYCAQICHHAVSSAAAVHTVVEVILGGPAQPGPGLKLHCGTHYHEPRAIEAAAQARLDHWTCTARFGEL